MVEFYLGKRTYHSYALENVAYGTANVATNWGYLGAVDKIDIDNTYENKALSVMDDVDTRNIGDYVQLVKRYKRTIEFKPQHGRFLILAYGSDTFSTGTPATHTITEANDPDRDWETA